MSRYVAKLISTNVIELPIKTVFNLRCVLNISNTLIIYLKEY